MKIDRIVLRNFCQHSALDWEFPNGIIALIGPNGAGKSNVIKGAYAALTGDFRRNEGVLTENINTLCSEKDESFVELTFSSNGNVSTIMRSLRPNKRSLVVNGSKAITSEKEISSTIEGLIGVSSDILSDYIFVDQWKMFDVFTASKANRLSALQSLYGLGKAEVCYDEITKSLSKIKTPIFVEDVEVIEAQIRDKKIQLNDLNKFLADTSSLVTDPTETQGQLDIVRKIKANRQSIETLRSSISFAESSIDKIAASTPTIPADELNDSEQLAGLIDQATADLSACKLFESKKAKLSSIQSRIDDATNKVNELGTEPAKPEKYIASSGPSYDEYQAFISDYSSRIKNLEEVKSSNKCPVCRSTGEALNIAINILESSIDKDKGNMELWAKAYNDSRKYDRDIVTFNANSSKLATIIEGLNNELNDTLAIVAEEPLESSEICANKLAELKAKKSALDANLKLVAEAQSKIQFFQGQITAANSQIAALEQESKSFKIDPSSTEIGFLEAGLSELIIEINQRKEAKIRAEEAIKAAKDSLDMLEKRKAAIAKEMDEAKSNEMARKHLENLREVMHKSNLPKKVTFNYLKQTISKTNNYLEDFHAPFRAFADDELTFWVKFNDGREMPASRLSGGEKVVLALAFRLAVQFGIAAGVNLLVLDEPTVGLDEDNIECLETAFNRLRAMSKSSGLQVLVVSHEKAIERMCDHTLSLYR